MSLAGRNAVEAAARSSYGRLVAFLAARSHDVAAAEDALADAFRVALEVWPASGVPERPEAWLLTTARRRLIDAARRRQVAEAAAPTLLAIADEAEELVRAEGPFPDERLKLMFVCAHPAIAPEVHTPLMLQTVLGLDAARIGSAFLVAPKTMGQRLSRAKLKIRAAGIAFEVPESRELPGRLQAVLDAIYVAYTCGWDGLEAAGARGGDLAADAIALGRLVLELSPGHAEAEGLVALMLHCEARRAARRDEGGAFVALAQQDVGRWDTRMIGEAEALLLRASGRGGVGRYQLEAAIQSAHAARLVSGATDWDAILLLHNGLAALTPSIGAAVSRIAALAQATDPATAMALLEALGERGVETYQPYWALFADLAARTGRLAEARAAYDRAAGLSADPALRSFLAARKARLPA